jgi:signal transduction histidine kinase
MSGYYITSVISDDVPALGLNGNFLGMFSVFIFLSLSVIRYRLFDIDRWWFEMWLWFFAGIAVVALDLILISLIGFAPSYALVLAVVIAAWGYFPLRQWLLGRMFHRSRQNLDDYLPLLVGYFVQAEHADAMTIWKRVLSDVFRPLSVTVGNKPVNTAEIAGNGTCMSLPGLAEKGSIQLYYADKGHRLFNGEDIRVAEALLSISKSSMAQREYYAKGVRDERNRIMRDLHDDVGGRLLTLTHSPHGESATAAEALKSLREIIYALDTEQHVTLNSMLARWRIEVLERCELEDIRLEWEWDELDKDIELSHRQALNLTLILREVLSNMLMHAKASRIGFEFHVADNRLSVQINNDGVPAELVDIKEGKGLKNMRQRTEELGGELRYCSSDERFTLDFFLPLSWVTGV